jgi:hypothetical protein
MLILGLLVSVLVISSDENQISGSNVATGLTEISSKQVEMQRETSFHGYVIETGTQSHLHPATIVGFDHFKAFLASRLFSPGACRNLCRHESQAASTFPPGRFPRQTGSATRPMTSHGICHKNFRTTKEVTQRVSRRHQQQHTNTPERTA